jgi:hypothetical protein
VHEPSGELAFRSPSIAAEALHHSVKSAWISDDPMTLRAAVQVADTLRDMKAQGYIMPDEVGIGMVSGGTNQLAGATQWTRPAYDAPIGHREIRTSLNLNVPDAAPKSIPLNLVARLALGETVTRVGESSIPGYTVRAYKDIVVHEMGHLQAGPRSYSGLTIADLTPQDGPWRNDPQWFRQAAQEVSAYASKSTDEFLAEAFTVQYRGESLGPKAAVLYDVLKGPKVRQ